MKFRNSVFSSLLFIILTILLTSPALAGFTIKIDKDLPQSSVAGVPGNLTFTLYATETTLTPLATQVFTSGTWKADYDFTQFKGAAPEAMVTFSADFTNTDTLTKDMVLWVEMEIDGIVKGSRELISQETWALFAVEAVVADDVPDKDITPRSVSVTGFGSVIDNAGNWTGVPPVGLEGPIGPEGPQGIQGVAGTDGADGANGADGPEGPQGIQGVAGTDGTNGANGADGLDGAIGPEGPQGIQGVAGTDGADGADGAIGPDGPQGIQGVAGTDGTDGANGTDGLDGAIGPEGPQGIQGVAGTDGADGPKGPEGPQGIQGNDGPAASAPLDLSATTSPVIKGTHTTSGNYGELGTDNSGVLGSSSLSKGVAGISDSGIGVYGHSDLGNGAYGGSLSSMGVRGESSTGQGVYGRSTSGTGVHGLHFTSGNYGELGTNAHGVQGKHSTTGNHGDLGTFFYGVFGSSATGVGSYGVSSSNIGVQGWGATYDFYAAGPGTNYGPFTGGHEAKLADGFGEVHAGMIVSLTGRTETRRADDGTVSISSTLPTVALSDKANDQAVFGVLTREADLPEDHWYTGTEGERFAIVNALGEGRVWVSNIGGDIQVGDYLTTSEVVGIGQTQDDNILYSHTLGKAMENVDWESVTETIEYNGRSYKVYLIAVVYTSG